MTKLSEGLDLDAMEQMSTAELEHNLLHVWDWRGPLYEMGANSLMLDYMPPQFSKAHRWGSDFFGRPDLENIALLGVGTLAAYLILDWETGILNQFQVLRRNGMSRQQIMEIVMFVQLYGGMRQLGHVYRAVGDMLPMFAEPTNPPAKFPVNWNVDPDAFKSGLDLSTREFTERDRRAITGWYRRHIGYVPESIAAGLEMDPEFMKMNRMKWENAIVTLPKQVAPQVMIRINMITGNVEGLRESVLLAKNWGISRQHVINGIFAAAMYFTAFEGLHNASQATRDIFRDWPPHS
jgi:alkylhydroperoxidase/carboxymuconolactone decarboxylase family protein YurZ